MHRHCGASCKSGRHDERWWFGPNINSAVSSGFCIADFIWIASYEDTSICQNSLGSSKRCRRSSHIRRVCIDGCCGSILSFNYSHCRNLARETTAGLPSRAAADNVVTDKSASISARTTPSMGVQCLLNRDIF
jgi:hypothetical protein